MLRFDTFVLSRKEGQSIEQMTKGQAMGLRTNILQYNGLNLDGNRISCERKTWTHIPSVSRSYSRLAGRLADEIWHNFEII